MLILLACAARAHAQSLPPDWYDDDEWHLTVRYLSTPVEAAVYRAVKSAAEREAFIETFWSTRDRVEFERRVAYANEHFTNPADAPHTGLDTDRGRVYVLFGAPDSIMTFASGAFELWRYAHLHGREVTFKFSLPPIDSCDGSFRLIAPAPLATFRTGATSVEVGPERFATVRIRMDFNRVSSVEQRLRTAGGKAVQEGDAPFWDGSLGPAGTDPLSRHILGCRMFDSGGMGYTHPLPPGSYVFTSIVTMLNGARRKESVRFRVP